MTFKDELTKKADHFETDVDILENVEFIKNQLEVFCSKRRYTISLVKPHGIMALGSCNTNHSDIFIPKQVEPNYYRQLFVDAFKALGFTDEDIELQECSCSSYDAYNITLRW